MIQLDDSDEQEPSIDKSGVVEVYVLICGENVAVP